MTDQEKEAREAVLNVFADRSVPLKETYRQLWDLERLINDYLNTIHTLIDAEQRFG